MVVLSKAEKDWLASVVWLGSAQRLASAKTFACWARASMPEAIGWDPFVPSPGSLGVC